MADPWDNVTFETGDFCGVHESACALEEISVPFLTPLSSHRPRDRDLTGLALVNNGAWWIWWRRLRFQPVVPGSFSLILSLRPDCGSGHEPAGVPH